MLDYVAGNLSPAMALAGDLHLLLSDDGVIYSQEWSEIAKEFSTPGIDEFPARDFEHACAIASLDYDRLHWRKGITAARYATIDKTPGRFMKLNAGKSVPMHNHKALEVTLVMQGSLVCGDNVYEQGDIMFGLPGQKHKPRASEHATCVCFVAKS